MSYKVKLQSFEGPFDLLVYLIENAEMNIYDIEISKITGQYLDYIKAMEEMDISVSTEFMVLASSLIEIKSKMILPRMSNTGEDIIEEDPRSELVARLVEYKRYKKAAEILQEREEISMRIFQKPQEDISEFLEQPDDHEFEAVKKHYTRVEREKASIDSRINYIVNKLKKKLGQVFNFKDLILDKHSKYDVVITFISLLEMAKERVVKVKQESTYGSIQVGPGERIDEGDIKYEQ